MYTAKIRVEDAKPDMRLAESVYHTTKSGSSMLVARKGADLSKNIVRMLETLKIEKIDIFTNNLPHGQQIKTERQISVKSIVDRELRKKSVESVKQLFDCLTAPDIDKISAYRCLNDVDIAVGNLLDVITDESTGLIHINDLKQFDEYTYHHSLSVSVLSMTTGRELGFDSDKLKRLGRCAMLHDIGKKLIPHEIINKDGRLTEEEFSTVKNHPSLGAKNLITSELGDEELWEGVIHHHEKINGKGYPDNLKGNEIPVFSKIIAVADVYDAITSYRSYRSPLQPRDAFDVIFKEINASFDYDIVKAFYTKLEFFPTNTIVELNDGSIGIVTENNNTQKLRPTVRLWGSDKVLDLARSTNKDLSIKRVISPTDLPDGYEMN